MKHETLLSFTVDHYLNNLKTFGPIKNVKTCGFVLQINIFQ